MSVHYIGIDVGTSLIKGQLLTGDGQPIASASFPSPTYEKEGISFLSAEKSFQCVYDILRQLFAKADGEVNGICFSSIGEAFALVDESGKSQCDFILFVSSLGDEETNALLSKEKGEDIALISGCYPNRMYSFSKLMHLKKANPSFFQKGTKMLMVAQYMVYRLSGVMVSDYSLAARTMLFDVKNKTWSQRLLDLCDLPASLFPKPVKSDAIVGALKPSIKESLGAKGDCLILASGHDQLMAALGSGLSSSGMANDGIGTAECLTLAFEGFPESEGFYRNNFCAVPYVIDGLYLTYAFLSTGGALLKWHRDKLSPLEAEKALEMGEDYYALMNEKDITLPTDLLILPYFSGSGTPNIDGEDKGAILGLSDKTRKEDIYFAMMEGASFEVRLNMDLIEGAGIPIKSVSATGGGAKSKQWLRIKSNIYNRPISTLDNVEGGIYGCFLMCKHSLEGIPYEELFASFIRHNPAYLPQEDLQKEYEKRYRIYKRIYPALKRIR